MQAPTALYYAAMVTIHLGFFWGLRNTFVAIKRRRFIALVLTVGSLVMLGANIFRVYEVIPALWWPNAAEHFVDRVVDCLRDILFIGVFSLGLLQWKRAAPEGSGS